MNLRNTTLSLLALTLAGGATAQLVAPRSPIGFSAATQHVTPRAPRAEQGTSRQVVLFSEDFANGFAGNNDFGSWTTSGADGAIWKYDTFGPTGAYSDLDEIIESATVANGFALFNSDSANTDFSVDPPVIVATPIEWEGSLESPVMTLPLNTGLEITFHQGFRYCCQDAPVFLEVSTDAGLSWPTSISVGEGVEGNDAFDGVSAFNITNALEGSDGMSVKIRFRHSADAGTSHYYWQVDDINIQTLEGFDMRMVSASQSSFVNETAGTYDSLAYSVYPLNQLRGLPLNMTVLNNGGETETTAVATFEIDLDGNQVLSTEIPVPNFAPGEIRTIYIDPNYTPSDVGTYTVNYSISSDEVDPTDNNTSTSTFKVDPYVYGRDGGTAASFEDGPADGSEFVLGSAFYVGNAADITSVDVLLGSASDLGAIIVGQVRNTDADFTVVATSQEVEVTAGMLNAVGGSNWTNLIFASPYALDANTDYLITVEAFGEVTFGQNGTSPAQTSFIRYGVPAQPLDWYYTTTTPCVRMNFDASVGIEAKDVSSGVGMGQNLPNPANGTTTIPYTLENTARVTFEVRDMSGKLLLTSNEGIRAAGTYRLNMDTNVLSEGVYTYTMRAGDVKQTKRMTVIK